MSEKSLSAGLVLLRVQPQPSSSDIGIQRELHACADGCYSQSDGIRVDRWGRVLNHSMTFQHRGKTLLAMVAYCLAFTLFSAIGTSGQPTVFVRSASVMEGDSGTNLLQVPVELSAVHAATVSVDYTIDGGFVRTGDVSHSGGGTLVFQPGETNKSVDISVTGDEAPEPNDRFEIGLSNPHNVTIETAVEYGRLIDDDFAGWPVDRVAANTNLPVITPKTDLYSYPNILIRKHAWPVRAFGGPLHVTLRGNATAGATFRMRLVDESGRHVDETHVPGMNQGTTNIPLETTITFQLPAGPQTVWLEVALEPGTTSSIGEYHLCVAGASWMAAVQQYVAYTFAHTRWYFLADQDEELHLELLSYYSTEARLRDPNGRIQAHLNVTSTRNFHNTISETGLWSFDMSGNFSPARSTIIKRSGTHAAMYLDWQSTGNTTIYAEAKVDGSPAIAEFPFYPRLYRREIVDGSATNEPFGRALANYDYTSIVRRHEPGRFEFRNLPAGEYSVELQPFPGLVPLPLQTNQVGAKETLTNRFDFVTEYPLVRARFPTPVVREQDLADHDITVEALLSTAWSNDVSVPFFTTQQSAREYIDFIPTNGTLTFLAGQRTQQVNITILADFEPEPVSETFFFNVYSLTNPVTVSGDSRIRILDDDLNHFAVIDYESNWHTFGLVELGHLQNIHTHQYEPPGPPPTISERRGDITMADVDGDGLPEVIRVWPYPASASAFLQSIGRYNLWEPDSYSSLIYTSVEELPEIRLGAGDLDGDNLADVIASSGVSANSSNTFHGIQAYLGSTNRQMWYPFGNQLRQPMDVAVGDLDGDGDNEIAVLIVGFVPGNESQISNVVAVVDADGQLVRTGAGTNRFSSVEVGDVTGDGKAEVILGTVGDLAPGRVVILHGVSLQTNTTFDVPGITGDTEVSVTDLDRDGIGEILVASRSGGLPLVAICDANGKVLERTLALDPDRNHGLRLAGYVPPKRERTVANTNNLPLLTIRGHRVTEGNQGTNNRVMFDVTADRPVQQAVHFELELMNNTATSGGDFLPLSGNQFTIGATETNKIIALDIIGDTTFERPESIRAILRNVQKAVSLHPTASAYIMNDDLPRRARAATSSRTSDGAFEIQWQDTDANTDYLVQYSTNLFNWNTLGRISTNGIGSPAFNDTDAIAKQRRYYRVIVP